MFRLAQHWLADADKTKEMVSPRFVLPAVSMPLVVDDQVPEGTVAFPGTEVFEHAPIPMVLARVDRGGEGEFFRVNAAMVRLSGYHRDELLTMSLRGFCRGLDAERSAALGGLLGGVLASCRFETRFDGGDGQIRWAQVDACLVVPGTKKAAYAIVQVQDTTERKQSDVRTSQLASLVDSTADAIVGMGLTGTITSWNRGAASLYGYPAAEAIGQPIGMLVPPDRRDQIPSLLPQIICGDGITSLETIRIAKDGRPIDVSLTVCRVDDGGGELIGLSVIARDITAQKRMEAELRNSSRYFDLSRDLVCTATFDGYFQQLNGAWTESLGWTDAELRSRPFVEFVHPDDRQATMAETAKLADGMTVIAFVNRYAAKDGGWRWLDWNARIAPDEQVIYATARDVTGRKRTEAALIASEARTRQIIETAHDAFVAIDPSGAITDWNPQAATLFGWSRREAVGRNLTDTIIPERDVGAHRRGLARYLATGQALVLGRRLELTGRHRDGHEFPIEMTISVVPDKDGVSFNAFLRDISERRQAHLAIEQARDQALEASVLKSNFLANMSHEIRTPMNGVLGMTELLLETPLDACQRQYAETVRASGDALLTIINDILDLSKIEAGRLELETIGFYPGSVVEDVIDLFSGPARSKGLELVTAIADDVPAELRGDPGRIRQVLTNLLGNAVKFTAAGYVKLSVTVTGSDDDRTILRLQVDDTGIGIDPGKAAHVFEPFAQADSSTTRVYGGTGLGLTITRQLVELMGGRCGFDSRPRVGSSFWFSLPLARAVAKVPTAASPQARAPGRGLVLLAEDNVINQKVATAMLQSGGYQVDVAVDGIEAVRAVRARQYDAVLMDCQMPKMDGFEAAAAIRAEEGTGRRVPIIAMTAGAMPEDKQRCTAAGMDDYLTKPARKETLLAAISNWVGDAVPE